MLGMVQVYRHQRWYLWFSLIAFVCVGPLFVWMTNLNLATAPSALFVLQRFFLLSHVVLAPLLAFGVLFIMETIIASAATPRLAYVVLIAGAGLSAVVATLLMNYSKIDQSHNHIARRFGEDELTKGDLAGEPAVLIEDVDVVDRFVRPRIVFANGCQCFGRGVVREDGHEARRH